MNHLSYYRRFRRAGYPALQARHSAKMHVEWDAAEALGLVRLVVKWDDNFDASDLDARGLEILERDGAWGVVGQYRLDTKSDWQTADSIWGYVGYRDVTSPYENWYVPDIMHETLAALESNAHAPESLGLRDRTNRRHGH